MENNTTLETSKINGFDQLSIWYKFTRLAVTTNSVNLGQGFPDWQPPKFLKEALHKALDQDEISHQYSRSMGNIKLVESIARNYQQYFEHKIDPLTEILVTNGAMSFLYNAVTAFVEKDDEVILIEPFYDCYLAQIQFSGGKAICIPMIPPKPRKREEFIIEGDDKAIEEHYNKIKDIWEFDFDKLEASINERTKLLILNTPNNPTGKVLTMNELEKIAKIVEKYPRIIVLMDEVYEHNIYNTDMVSLPRMANIPGMWDRCLSVMSAGKIFSATGIRVGWGIGPKNLISKVVAIFQFGAFCLYDPTQVAIAECLDIANQPYQGFENYFKWLRDNYIKSRNYLIMGLAKSKGFELPFYLPEGGFFILASLNEVEVPKTKFRLEGDEDQKEVYLKDYNYILELANTKGFVCIPCNKFYSKENKKIGENFIRLAFLKQISTLDKALLCFK